MDTDYYFEFKYLTEMRIHLLASKLTHIDYIAAAKLESLQTTILVYVSIRRQLSLKFRHFNKVYTDIFLKEYPEWSS